MTPFWTRRSVAVHDRDTTPNEDHFEERNQEENFTNDKHRKSPTRTKRGLPESYEVPETRHKSPKQLKKDGHKKQRTRRLDKRGEDTAEREPVFGDADEDHDMM